MKVCEKLNLNLVVREHPATIKYFNKNWRNKEYIKSIYKLGNKVMIDDCRESNIDIILKSKVTASISGTVITESLINGIPSIAFGNHPLKGWNGDSLIEFENDINKFILEISISLKLKKYHIKKEIENYLKKIVKITFGNDFSKLGKEYDPNNLRESRENGLIQFLNQNL